MTDSIIKTEKRKDSSSIYVDCMTEEMVVPNREHQKTRQGTGRLWGRTRRDEWENREILSFSLNKLNFRCLCYELPKVSVNMDMWS